MTQGWKKITDSGVGLGGQVALLGHSNINTIRIYTLLRHLILRSGDLPRDRLFSCIAKYYGDIRLKSIDYQPNKRRLRNSMVLIVRNICRTSYLKKLYNQADVHPPHRTLRLLPTGRSCHS